MATFILIPGADGRAWYWNRVVPLLTDNGHEAMAVDLPVEDPAAGFEAYIEHITAVIGEHRSDLVLVGQSMGGFVAPLVAERMPGSSIILLNAMVPQPGESLNEWWTNTGHEQARKEYYDRLGLDLPTEFDPIDAFFHDFAPDVLNQAMSMGEPAIRFDTLFAEPWPLASWPDVPTRFIQARNDRFFPLDFQRRVVKERLGIPIEEIPGGHLAALSHPAEVAEHLMGVRALDSQGTRG